MIPNNMYQDKRMESKCLDKRKGKYMTKQLNDT